MLMQIVSKVRNHILEYWIPWILSGIGIILVLFLWKISQFILEQGAWTKIILWFASWIVILLLLLNVLHRFFVFIKAWFDGMLHLSALLEMEDAQRLKTTPQDWKAFQARLKSFFLLIIALAEQLLFWVWTSLYSLVFPVIKSGLQLLAQKDSKILKHLEQHPLLIRFFSALLVVFAVAFLISLRF